MADNEVKDRGFIHLHRKILEWEWYDDANTLRVFLHLLLKANFKTVKWHGTTIPAGGLITSYATLAQELRLSVREVRTAINHLKTTGELTSKTTSKYTVIKLAKWRDYQTQATSKTTSETTGERQANDKQATSKRQQDNNDNNDNNDNKSLLSAEEKKRADFLKILLPDREVNNPTETESVFRAYMKASPTRLTEAVAEQLQALVDEYGEEKVITAIDKAVKQNSVRLSYIEAILRDKGGSGKGKTLERTPYDILMR